MTRLTVNPGEAGSRLDRWLAARLPEFSRSRLQALIKQGHVRVNGAAAKAHRKMAEGEETSVDVPPPTPVAIGPEAIPLRVLHEDAHIIVIDKPAGLVVHPAPGHPTGTLVNALLHHCRDLGGIGGELRPGIVHRLDKDTSGVLVVAKTEASMRNLVSQFKGRQVAKEYVALVRGRPSPPSGTIETLIGRSVHDRQKMSAKPRRGRAAVTHYETTETFSDFSLVRLRMETGRTHQIRVHMTHIGHPILGDDKYGRGRSGHRVGPAAARQMLHAERLSFRHPADGKSVTFQAPMPADMLQILRG